MMNSHESFAFNNLETEGDETGKGRRVSMMDEKKVNKVTYSFDGKVMPYKELHLEEKKLNAPHILIQ